MRFVLFLLVLTAFEYDAHSFRIHRHRQSAPPSSGKYRISPKTGVRIALPSMWLLGYCYVSCPNILLFSAPEQLQWQAQELGLLVCFNLATYLETDGCVGQMVPSVSLFAPTFLNTDNWAQTMVDFGAQYAVLVAKVISIETSFVNAHLCHQYSMHVVFSCPQPMLPFHWIHLVRWFRIITLSIIHQPKVLMFLMNSSRVVRREILAQDSIILLLQIVG